jgi:uncharacterized cupin superfamily protein
VALRKVNVCRVELDHQLDVAGFRHAGTAIGERLGAQAIGAGVYTAEPGHPIWPYHYHHGVEEWLYLISGAPVLRERAGRRTLSAGDLVCFPRGPAGTHTLEGPGRFVIFSTGTHRDPWMSVYPDSDKVSGPEGILLRSSAVDYWYGEGTGAPAEPVTVPRSVMTTAPLPIVNLTSRPATDPPTRHGAPSGFAARQTHLGPDLGAEMLGATLFELDPSEGTAPYHYHSGREEWLLVLAGTPTLRHPDAEDVLEVGDVVCFVEGPGGAHRVLNRSSEPARLLILSTMRLPVSAHYPDSGKILFREADGNSYVFRKTDAVDYWEGER